MNFKRKRSSLFVFVAMFVICTVFWNKDTKTAHAASVSISKKSATISKNESMTLKLKGNKKTIKWKSSNSKVAKVTKSGKVTGVKKGTATITATVGKKKYTCKVKVETPSLSKTSTSVYIDKTVTLKLKNTSRKVSWSSSNKKVATVDKNGKVKGIKSGTVTITAKVGTKKYSAKVKVNSVLLVSSTNVTMQASKSVTCTMKQHASIQYVIADPSIVSCKWGNWDGKNIKLNITGLKNGSTTITIKNYYNKETRVINVTVNGLVIPTGEVTGCVSFYFNDFWGHRGDVGASVNLIPKDGSAAKINVDSYTDWTSHTVSLEKYGVYKAEADSTGTYQILNVPKGEYLAFIISKKTTSESWFENREEYRNKILENVSGVLSDSTANTLVEAVSYNKYIVKSVKVYGDKSTRLSHDFGSTYN